MRQRILIGLALLLVVLGGVYLFFFQPDEARLSVADVSGRTPNITPPRTQLIPTIGVAEAVGWQQGEMPTPAAGLKVGAFAAGLSHPRWLYQLPNGDVLVAETNSPPRTVGGVTGWVMGRLMSKGGAAVPSPNRITLLRDTNHDGVAEARTVLIGGLNSPSGMALLGGYLYVADTDQLLRFPFTAGQTKIDAKPETVIKYPGGGNHWARNVIVAEDGKTLYLSVGSSTNIAEDGLEAEKTRAVILHVYPDQKRYDIFASGVRNANGMAIEPIRHALWAVVNERDMLGSDLPPDYMSAIEPGDNFGWPWFYWGRWIDHRVKPERPDLQEYIKFPDYALGPHTASLGLAFATGAKLGGNYTQGAFVGQHGSWNRVPPSGYKVIFVPFAANGFPVNKVKPMDVLTGFLDASGDHARGRPVGVIVDADGGLLVADDVGNTIWRVTAK